jgi:hypothetical protein
MKLSTKLLAITLGIIMVGMLTSQILMKVEYDSLKYRKQPPSMASMFSKPFKHIYVESPHTFYITIQQSDKFDVSVNYQMRDSLKVYIQNDTLKIKSLMKINQNQISERGEYGSLIELDVYLPEIMSIYSNQNNIRIEKLNQKSLKLTVGSSDESELIGNTIENLDITLDKETSIAINNYSISGTRQKDTIIVSKFDVLKIRLDTLSDVRFGGIKANKIQLKTTKNNRIDGLNEDLLKKIEVLK